MTASSAPRVILALVLSASVIAPRTVRAEAEGTEGTVQEARALFVEGKNELSAGHFEQALTLLSRSHARVASPNTELLLARALSGLGRRVDAVAALERTSAEAERRVALGEDKYAATARAARDEAASLRARLGTVVVRVADRAATRVHVDGQEVALSLAGESLVLHEPGPVEIVALVGGVEQRQVATALAGGTLRVDFSGAKATVTEQRPSTPVVVAENTRPWATPLALASGGAAVAGAGLFTLFGLRSGETYETLASRCGPGACGAADRAEADAGQRDQTIANVSLVVAGVAAVSFVTFLVLAKTAPTSPRTARTVDAVFPRAL